MNWLNRFKDRKVVYGTGSVVSVLLVVGILVVAALLADWHQSRWDLTRGQTQSLSALTRNLLKQVDKPLTMEAFLPEGSGERDTVKDVLQRYAYINPKISFNFVDPEREPLKAKEAGYRFPGNVLLTYNGKHQMADRADEEAITNTLRRTLKTNTFAALRMCQVFLPLMKRHGYGRVVNVSSDMGQHANMRNISAAYRLSKDALNALTQMIADSIKTGDILVNSVHPGWVRTDMGGASASRSVEQGADTIIWLATLPPGGPTGGFFEERKRIDW